MARRHFYICHPPESRHPLAGRWVRAAIESRDDSASNAGSVQWQYRVLKTGNDCTFSPRDFASQILENRGPILFVNPVKAGALAHLRSKIGNDCVVEAYEMTCEADVIAGIELLQEMHLDGEPRIPRRQVVALLILAKLWKQDCWGGNNKSYMWAKDIPKGRGVPIKYKADVPELLNLMFLHGLLQSKPSKGGTKFALINSDRPTVAKVLKRRQFPQSLQLVLEQSGITLSARILDNLLVGTGLDID